MKVKHFPDVRRSVLGLDVWTPFALFCVPGSVCLVLFFCTETPPSPALFFLTTPPSPVATSQITWGTGRSFTVCVCVCVCVRERERARERESVCRDGRV